MCISQNVQPWPLDELHRFHQTITRDPNLELSGYKWGRTSVATNNRAFLRSGFVWGSGEWKCLVRGWRWNPPPHRCGPWTFGALLAEEYKKMKLFCCNAFLFLYKRGNSDLRAARLIPHWSDPHLAKARQFVIFVLRCALVRALYSFLINMLLKALFLRQDGFSFWCGWAPARDRNVWQRPSGVRMTDARAKRKLVCIQVRNHDVKQTVKLKSSIPVMLVDLVAWWKVRNEAPWGAEVCFRVQPKTKVSIKWVRNKLPSSFPLFLALRVHMAGVQDKWKLVFL